MDPSFVGPIATSAAPAPGTTTLDDWGSFIGSIGSAASQIIRSTSTPPPGYGGYGGYNGSTQPYLGQGPLGSSGLGLLLLIVLVFVIVEK